MPECCRKEESVMSNFKILFSPIRIGTMEVKNRLVVPAMGTNLAEPDHTAGDALIEYYTQRARGGFGLIITECTAVAPEGASLVNECAIWDDSFIPGYQKLTASVHEAGAKICCQLRHTGRETEPKYTDGHEIVAPSPVPCPACQAMPHEMTTEEVYDMTDTFAQAALRAKEAGFDAVEIHASHGYLPAQFLSAHANKRTDEFGGSLRNRMRFLRLILEKTRTLVGEDYPVLVRLSGSEMIAGGREIQETKAVAQMLEASGCAAINVSISTYGSLQYCVGSSYLEPGYEAAAAAEVKKAVSIPVITVGRFTDPEIAEAVLADGSADLVAIGRQSIADPEFAVKAQTGREDDILPCISCGQGCIMHMFTDEPISCVMNPHNCPEEDYAHDKTQTPKRILIAGGGPGGLQAAWILAARGHQVTLCEKEGFLGGWFLAAAYPPGKGTICRGIAFWERQCKKYGVDVRLHTEVTEDLVRTLAPDVLIVATGSTNLVPRIPGLGPAQVLEPCDVLLGKKVTGHRVLVCGGGLIGVETADFLAEQKRDVTVIEMKPVLAPDLDPYARPMLMQAVKNGGVHLLSSAAIQEFFPDGVTYKDLTGKLTDIQDLRGFDSVVLALGHRSYEPFGEKLKALVKEVYVVGDANRIDFVSGATYLATQLAETI